MEVKTLDRPASCCVDATCTDLACIRVQAKAHESGLGIQMKEHETCTWDRHTVVHTQEGRVHDLNDASFLGTPSGHDKRKATAIGAWVEAKMHGALAGARVLCKH